MRIATWNVNGLRARFDFVLHWLRARQPDIVGLQELKVAEDKFPHAEFEAEGYHALIHSAKAWNGVAILSRESGQIKQRGLPGQEEMGPRLISASLGELVFITIYCPNGKHVAHQDFGRKLEWLDALGDYLEDQHTSSEAIVLCGDFNICPTDLDSWNEEDPEDRIFHTEAERNRFRRLLNWGLTDAYRELFPDRRMFSWWDYRAGAFHRNLGLRIDFALASQSVMKRVRDVEIDRDYRKKKEGLTASDHAPVIVELSSGE